MPRIPLRPAPHPPDGMLLRWSTSTASARYSRPHDYVAYHLSAEGPRKSGIDPVQPPPGNTIISCPCRRGLRLPWVCADTCLGLLRSDRRRANGWSRATAHPPARAAPKPPLRHAPCRQVGESPCRSGTAGRAPRSAARPTKSSDTAIATTRYTRGGVTCRREVSRHAGRSGSSSFA